MKKEFWLKNAHPFKETQHQTFIAEREKKKRMHSAEKVTGTTFGIAIHRNTSYWNYFCFNHSDMNWKEGERNRPKETLFFSLLSSLVRLWYLFFSCVSFSMRRSICSSIPILIWFVAPTQFDSNPVVYWQTVSNYKLLMRVKCNLIRCWINESDVLLIHRRIKTK